MYVHGAFSSEQFVSCGVPQGLILGLLFYAMYISDKASAVTCDLCLYTDDSMLLVSGKNLNNTNNSLKTEMSAISKCLQ